MTKLGWNWSNAGTDSVPALVQFHPSSGIFMAYLQDTCNRLEHHGLTHWGRETHICVSKLTIIASDNGLSPGRLQDVIWTNAGILLIGPLGTNFNEILIEIHTFSFKKMHLKMSFAKWRPFCLGPNVLMQKHHMFILVSAVAQFHPITATFLSCLHGTCNRPDNDITSYCKTMVSARAGDIQLYPTQPLDCNKIQPLTPGPFNKSSV